VIDDTPEALDLYRTVFEMEGYEVHTASNGNDALAMLSQIAPPSLILSDIRMGEMSGPEFLVVLERDFPDIFAQVPVVFLTGLSVVPETKAASVLHKPVDINELLESVDRLIKASANRRTTGTKDSGEDPGNLL
jgi:CheY-like chemotaxis protein